MNQFYEINSSPPQSPTEQPKMSTLFLGDLSVLCDEEKLIELFRPYGSIESIHLKKSTRDPLRGHLGFGFIKFVNHEDAERAIKELNGLFFLGRAMRVGWGKDFDKLHVPVDGLEKLVDPKKHRQTAQIHVTFVSRELRKLVSEMDLGAVFGTFGNVVDIAIKKNAINEVSSFLPLIESYIFMILSDRNTWSNQDMLLFILNSLLRGFNLLYQQ